ncbi:MAG: DNA polymerase/3'-5' exonuclease PolX [Planctomycetes bacterium]|nr:DNA polymerase/3'-5' exonuclease PolX [Planctomycetota bacterium]
MDNRAVEAVLNEIAALLELKGANTFKVRAYQNAARAVGNLQEDVGELVESGEIKSVRGIGKSIQEKLKELHETEELVYLEELRSGVPEGLFEIMTVPGMGPKKTKVVWEELSVTTLVDLETACKEDQVAGLKGFGKKSQAKILDGIEHLELTRGRRLRSQALPQAARLKALLEGVAGVERVEVAGSLRRGRETVKDVDLLVASLEPEAVMEAARDDPEVDSIIGSGATKTSVRLKDGLQVDVRVVEPRSFACALAYFTGSKDFNVALRGMALDQGYSLNEYDLRPLDGSPPPEFATEEELHKALGLAQYVPPELRENTGEIAAAIKGELPTLIEPTDLQGILHVHTKWSDGTGTVDEMVRGAVELGYDYLGISDHSEIAGYANGLSVDRLHRQREEIEAAREAYPQIRIFHGCEVDILGDGQLDLTDECLEWLDFVIASVHMELRQERSKMTKRLVRAMSHPQVRVFGHPLGRKLLKRDSSAFDWEPVLDACVENSIAVEVNGSPHRLDADWVHVRRIRARGVKLCVNPDAHAQATLIDAARYGVCEARRGWASKEDVVNTLDLAAFEKDFLRIG